jgi:hypothetical protein
VEFKIRIWILLLSRNFICSISTPFSECVCACVRVYQITVLIFSPENMKNNLPSDKTDKKIVIVNKKVVLVLN